MSNTDPFTKILNQILEGVVKNLNTEIGPAIKNAGYDPYKNVASGKQNIGVGEAHYSVTNLTGLSSFQIQDMVVSNVESQGSSLIGDLTFHANLTDQLATTVGGGVKVLFVANVGISGNVRIDGATVSGTAKVKADMDTKQICISNISGLNADFNYSSADIWINNLGVLNYLLKPVESLILDATKGSIRSLISNEVDSLVSSELNKLLPQCASL